ncbi:MAG: glycosyltransferase [Kiritimatiellia bacterium]|jgi:glycosyltransferase involved in cell wall biosynthesis
MAVSNLQSRPAIHQFVAGFTAGDAISNEALTMRSLFRSWGYASEIFSEPSRTMPAWRSATPDAGQAGKILRPHDVAVLHLSIGSAVNDVFGQLRCRKALVYHNMTPPEYFRGFHEQLACDLEWGRRQTAALADQTEVALAVSRFNAGELERQGYKSVKLLPLLLDFDRIMTPPDRGLLRRLRDGRLNVVFVGRAVPNKRLEDLLAAFYVLQQAVVPSSRLVHAGSFAGLPRYQALLTAQVKAWRLQNVLFLGSVLQRELSAVYAAADVFLCVSEHEGFCIPLLESMAHGVPTLAYAAGAVPETMAGAGILFRRKRWEYVAELIGLLARDHRDQTLREAIIRRQRERVAEYRQRDLATELRAHLAPLLKS